MLDTIEYKGYTIRIDQDDCPDSPRDWDNLGTMICFHNRYDLGDKHGLDVEELKALVKQSDIISLPLFLYDHSGVWMSTNRSYPFNCPWDSGQIGYIYVTKEKIRQEYDVKRIDKKTLYKVLDVLVGEVKTYSQYISGEVYCFVIDDPENEVIDSCCGFYDIDDMITECKATIDNDLTTRTIERVETTLVEIGC